ncbi:hypothetical protein FK178_10440 [Antarcticibacterium arcticum]|uniref:DUF748 domain-containing protein n=1 Tax=Antarcticibacterium arcticum TaxID=2585771 RepID=A0A5B8YKC5_9FLAO|nr:hypothetical protein [Antarcticibacterium arcticum]QED38115.1 hypothetical protein FK178_10440 [Antarcticibacterium arcticum]
MKKRKNLFILVAVLITVGIGAVYLLNKYIKDQIITGLEKEFPSSVLSYDDISVNVLGGNSSISNILMNNQGVKLSASRVNIRNFSYSSYLRSGDFEIGSLELIAPVIVINKSDTATVKKVAEGEEIERNLLLKKFRVIGGSLRVIENDSASNTLFVSIKNIELEKVLFGKKHKGALIPFEYDSYKAESDSLFYEINAWNSITVRNVELKEDLVLTEFRIIPKLSRAQFDLQIPYEKDWIALKVDQITFQDLGWSKNEDSLMIKSPQTYIENANLQIYRNKLVTDDTRIKPMYSQMLRELGVKLQLDSVTVKNSKIVYEEKVLESRPPAEISFQNVQAGIKDLVNFNPGNGQFPKTRIKAKAVFMGNSRLTLNWDFDVSNSMDEFHVWGSLAAIKAEAMNPFLKYAMNVETEGLIESLSYNFYGNRSQASGDMQMGYRDFKVNILKDGEEKRKSFLSRLANLIIKNDAINEDVKQESIETQRDKTKSFWNFLWLCIRDGALKTFF